MTEFTYDIRSAVIEKEKHFRLERDALVWTSKSGDGRIAYHDVARVSLIAGPSQYGQAANCAIKPKSGRRLVFGTVHFTSVVSCENRAAAYGPFVRELLRRISDRAPDAKILKGRSGEYITLNVALFVLIAVAVFILILVSASGVPPEAALLGFFAAIAVLVPTTVGFAGSRKPTPIDPYDPPAELVGENPETGQEILS